MNLLLTTLSLVLSLLTFARAAALPSDQTIQTIQIPNTPSSTNDNQFFPFGFTLTTYCDNNKLDARGTWTSYGFSSDMHLTSGQTVYIELGRGTDLFINWNSGKSEVKFAYGKCGWGMNEYKKCGWCHGHGWDKRPQHCPVSGLRQYKMDCVVNMGASKQGADDEAAAGDEAVETKAITARQASPPEGEYKDIVAQPTPTPKTVTQTYTALPTTSTHPHAASTPKFFSFTLDITEYCTEDTSPGIRQAQAYFVSPVISFTHDFGSPQDRDRIVAGVDLDLTTLGMRHLRFGPYDYGARKVPFQYGNNDCKWKEGEFKKCGWCVETEKWQPSGVIACAKGDTEARSHTLNCNIVVNWNNNNNAAQDQDQDQDEDQANDTDTSHTNAAARRDDLPPSPSVAQLPSEVNALAASKTTLIPKIIQYPDNTGTTEIILPFHFQTTESCSTDGTKLAHGIYSNGNVVAGVSLAPGVATGVNHLIPGYPDLSVGPFDYTNDRLLFTYTNGTNSATSCQWYDDEAWKACGECRAGLWSQPTLDCSSPAGGPKLRVKDMDCSFILGVKS
ncbi:hypothetical protein N0V83_010594 [Neocucurbitaria cava]|uniref:Uncharacterized protein n=1 Tax=Neocucurbitaria cava TaxID=798079 RepID=A0A9W8XZW8_9PLEO|nr:hypothetical protein N0V83_010594 [Neocucurbitaria cava]